MRSNALYNEALALDPDCVWAHRARFLSLESQHQVRFGNGCEPDPVSHACLQAANALSNIQACARLLPNSVLVRGGACMWSRLSQRDSFSSVFLASCKHNVHSNA